VSEVPLETQIITARDELAQTLDAIEQKLNVPKRLGHARARAKRSFQKNPAPWLAGAGAAALAIGGLVFAAVRRND
jgi:hypothetical protein